MIEDPKQPVEETGDDQSSGDEPEKLTPATLQGNEQNVVPNIVGEDDPNSDPHMKVQSHTDQDDTDGDTPIGG